LVVGDNLSYSGGLVVVAVPKGSTWALTVAGAYVADHYVG
jgi:hypothetical protein